MSTDNTAAESHILAARCGAFFDVCLLESHNIVFASLFLAKELSLCKSNKEFPKFAMLIVFLARSELPAQAIGEYGRTVEGARQRQRSVNSKASRPSQNSKGETVVEGIGDATAHPIPSGLIVASKQIGLYPRQDEAAEKITELFEGETLVPMPQSNSGKDWYMVKTQQGISRLGKSGRGPGRYRNKTVVRDRLGAKGTLLEGYATLRRFKTESFPIT